MTDTCLNNAELGQQARELYERLRAKVETPENIGKLIVMDVASGDYEIDKLGIEASLHLQARHPGSSLSMHFASVIRRSNLLAACWSGRLHDD
ncbi:MAG: hypothetical protein U1F76_24380 [Candidatus Competibacteraceae bacterium]